MLNVKDHKTKAVETDMTTLNTLMGEMPENYINIFQQKRDRTPDTYFEQKANNQKYFENILKFAKAKPSDTSIAGRAKLDRGSSKLERNIGVFISE